jgi:transcriptional regulator with XRE-family HTH domain
VSDPLGEIIRHQRELAAMSMRQFADMAGISNPYLSQIERGLREPSEQVLEAIAKTLRTSVDALYEEAGIPTEPEKEPAVLRAIREDRDLTPRQRQALTEIYTAFTAKRPSRPRRGRAASS